MKEEMVISGSKETNNRTVERYLIQLGTFKQLSCWVPLCLLFFTLTNNTSQKRVPIELDPQLLILAHLLFWQHGNSPLHLAVLGCHPSMTDLLVKKGASVNATNNVSGACIAALGFFVSYALVIRFFEGRTSI